MKVIVFEKTFNAMNEVDTVIKVDPSSVKFDTLTHYITIVNAIDDFKTIQKAKSLEITAARLIASIEETFKTVPDGTAEKNVKRKNGTYSTSIVPKFKVDDPIPIVKPKKATKAVKKVAPAKTPGKKAVKKTITRDVLINDVMMTEELRKPTVIYKCPSDFKFLYAYLLLMFATETKNAKLDDVEKTPYVQLVMKLASEVDLSALENTSELDIVDSGKKVASSFIAVASQLHEYGKSIFNRYNTSDIMQSAVKETTFCKFFLRVAISLTKYRIFYERAQVYTFQNFFGALTVLSRDGVLCASLYARYETCYRTIIVPAKPVKKITVKSNTNALENALLADDDEEEEAVENMLADDDENDD